MRGHAAAYFVVHATAAPEPLGLEVDGTLAALMADAPVKAAVGLRVGSEDEVKGLDQTSHGESGYNI